MGRCEKLEGHEDGGSLSSVRRIGSERRGTKFPSNYVAEHSFHQRLCSGVELAVSAVSGTVAQCLASFHIWLGGRL